MNQPTSTLHEINSFVRTLVICVVVGGIGYGGGWVYQNLYPSAALREKDRQIQVAQEQLTAAQADIEQLNTNLQVAGARIDELDTSLRYLKVNQRVADLVVLRQMQHPQTNAVLTEIAFQEVDSEGKPIEEARRFTIEGDVVYLDYWVVKFADRFVEQGDQDRGVSLCTFRRLFGESQRPEDGYPLDNLGKRPGIYGNGQASPFEQKIWNDFWNLANDPSRAEEMGIRAMHGEAVYMQVREGAQYQVLLRASDGLSITRMQPGQPAPQVERSS